ncbi:MAG: hypothetical protein D4R88_05245 [Methanosarcinales archaeon]|nr:MAG: hypothetical protein D4R88_05245 [Methanosarcinales archaeon]
MLFCLQCTVVELFPGEPFTHYRWLSTSLGHEYRNVVGEAHRGKHDDFSVALNALRIALEK